MCPAFRYDVAVSYVSEDALTARHLMERLRWCLQTPIFDAAEGGDRAVTGAPSAALQCDARVVVVLHQRLWGETSATRCDRTTIEERVAQEGSDFLVVVTLDPRADLPVWANGKTVSTTLSSDGLAEVDVIAAAVERAGGTARRAPYDGMLGVGGPDGAGDEETGRNSFKMANAAHREVTLLIEGIEERAEDLRVRFPDLQVEVRRTPERCVVQAGDLAVSVSWLRPSPTSSGHGTLLVMEWEGTVTLRGEPMRGRHHATVVREHALHLESPACSWSADEAPMRKYTSRDLASLCVRQMMWQLDNRQLAIAKRESIDYP